MIGRRRSFLRAGQIGLLCALVVPLSSVRADIYKWVDTNGGVHYSNKPPEGTNAKKVKVPITVVPSSPPAEVAAKPSPKEESELERLRRENEQLRQELEALRARDAQSAANPPQPQLVPYPVPVIPALPGHGDDKPRPRRPHAPEGAPPGNK
jgi:hypothetical protein